MSAPQFDTATSEEITTLLDWAAAEGWNPGRGDARAFMAADPDGFFVARVEGAMVAAVSVVNHDDTMAFLGLYLCAPAFRGRGIGYALWQHALAHAGTRTVGLDGVAAQQDNYAKSGFARVGATTRLSGRAPKVEAGVTRMAEAQDRPALLALDRAATGYARDAFLAAWLTSTKDRQTVVAEDARGSVIGMATARLCREGAKLGPVIAPDVETALALTTQASRAVGAEDLFIDLPSHQTAFRAALEASGFVATFETARMYRGTPPHLSPLSMAIATMELG